MTVGGYEGSRFGHSMASNRAGLLPTPQFHTDIDFFKTDLADRPGAVSGLIRGILTAFFLGPVTGPGGNH